MGKAKPAKHTAAELAAKAKAALTNMGGGKEGQADRKGGKAGHAKFQSTVYATQCHICKVSAPSLVSMQAHHDSKHPSMPWEPEKCTDMHEIHGATTVGVAVRGSKKH